MKAKNCIAKVCKSKGMSCRNLARLTGIPRSTLSDIGNHKRLPNQLQMMKIAKVLKMEVTDVFDLSIK